jgi:hypothetical protein
MQGNQTFYVVTRDNNNLNCSKRHETFEQAESEAMQLSEKERGSFIILKAVAIYRPAETPIEKVVLTDKNEFYIDLKNTECIESVDELLSG